MRDTEVNGRNKITPKPETEEYNVRNFVYSQRRPFHPKRLWAFLYDKFILQMEHQDDEDEDDDGEDDDDEDDEAGPEEEDEEEDDLTPPANAVILANKKASPLLNRLFRSKGEIWLATRPDQAGEWSQAGAMLTLTGGRPWFCTLRPSAYLTGDAEIDGLVRHDITKGGEWGDRRQELVFIGENLDVQGLKEVLDKCLLDEKEWGTWQRIMRGTEGMSTAKRQRRLEKVWDDGVPDWPEQDIDVDHKGHKHA
jgi:G3E family GTPase